MFWIHGGGFQVWLIVVQVGSGTQYNGTTLVSTSVTLGKPVIYVGINYRLAGFRFLGGKEVLADGSANLGLRGQRLALEWVADNIATFGGNPDRVILWSESVGSFFVNDQLALYAGNNTCKGKPTFHGLSSTLALSSQLILWTPPRLKIYDNVVEAANCTYANITLDCLRDIDYDTFVQATNSAPSFSPIGLWQYLNTLCLMACLQSRVDFPKRYEIDLEGENDV